MTLFDKIKQGDRVQGKMTKMIYTVGSLDPTAEEREDAIVLINYRDVSVDYTRAQFNANFKKVKK